jgi:prophage antirepressor-like protein
MENELKVVHSQEVLGKTFVVYGNKENPLFLAKDAADWIENKNVSQMLNVVDNDEKVICNIYTLGGNQQAWFLTEYGLYEVLMQSRKPSAKQFKSEVKKILKDIRLNGGYISDNATPEQVNNLVEAYTFKSITKQIKECDILKLKEVVTNIFETNGNLGKRNRDEYHKSLNAKEYKQHLREHIRKAVLEREYPKDYRSAIETAIRLELIDELDKDIMMTDRKSYSHKLTGKKRLLNF